MPDHVEPGRLAPTLMSFDVFGTLIDVRASSYAAFEKILAAAGAHHVDVREFWERWEHRNIEQYWKPYRSYRSLCETSLMDTLAEYGGRGHSSLINYYFDSFSDFCLYDDVNPTLDRLAARYKLAIVSNIDDDLLARTPLGRTFDLVCTAERARGYKPDGTLFRYLIRESGLSVSQILHSGQSQFTDMVGGKPLSLTIAWINRRDLDLSPDVPAPDFIFSGLEPLPDLLT